MDVSGKSGEFHSHAVRDSGDAPILVAAVELDGKKRISRLRLPIGDPGS